MSLECEGQGATCMECGEYDFLPSHCSRCGGMFCQAHITRHHLTCDTTNNNNNTAEGDENDESDSHVGNAIMKGVVERASQLRRRQLPEADARPLCVASVPTIKDRVTELDAIPTLIASCASHSSSADVPSSCDAHRSTALAAAAWSATEQVTKGGFDSESNSPQCSLCSSRLCVLCPCTLCGRNFCAAHRFHGHEEGVSRHVTAARPPVRIKKVSSTTATTTIAPSATLTDIDIHDYNNDSRNTYPNQNISHTKPTSESAETDHHGVNTAIDMDLCALKAVCALYSTAHPLLINPPEWRVGGPCVSWTIFLCTRGSDYSHKNTTAAGISSADLSFDDANGPCAGFTFVVLSVCVASGMSLGQMTSRLVHSLLRSVGDWKRSRSMALAKESLPSGDASSGITHLSVASKDGSRSGTYCLNRATSCVAITDAELDQLVSRATLYQVTIDSEAASYASHAQTMQPHTASNMCESAPLRLEPVAPGCCARELSLRGSALLLTLPTLSHTQEEQQQQEQPKKDKEKKQEKYSTSAPSAPMNITTSRQLTQAIHHILFFSATSTTPFLHAQSHGVTHECAGDPRVRAVRTRLWMRWCAMMRPCSSDPFDQPSDTSCPVGGNATPTDKHTLSVAEQHKAELAVVDQTLLDATSRTGSSFTTTTSTTAFTAAASADCGMESNTALEDIGSNNIYAEAGAKVSAATVTPPPKPLWPFRSAPPLNSMTFANSKMHAYGVKEQRAGGCSSDGTRASNNEGAIVCVFVEDLLLTQDRDVSLRPFCIALRRSWSAGKVTERVKEELCRQVAPWLRPSAPCLSALSMFLLSTPDMQPMQPLSAMVDLRSALVNGAVLLLGQSFPVFPQSESHCPDDVKDAEHKASADAAVVRVHGAITGNPLVQAEVDRLKELKGTPQRALQMEMMRKCSVM